VAVEVAEVPGVDAPRPIVGLVREGRAGGLGQGQHGIDLRSASDRVADAELAAPRRAEGDVRILGELSIGPAHYSAGSAQALNALAFDTFLPIVAGLIVFAIATGIAVIREAWLPAWLGWALVALGVITPSPALPVGLFGVVAWSAVVAVILFAGTPAERQRGARVSNAAAQAG
jgi:hypothetical protein